jgi:hypothetical protein
MFPAKPRRAFDRKLNRGVAASSLHQKEINDSSGSELAPEVGSDHTYRRCGGGAAVAKTLVNSLDSQVT